MRPDKFKHIIEYTKQQQRIGALHCKITPEDMIAILNMVLQGADGNSPVIPDGWVACSERMPEDEQEVLTRNKMGHSFVSFFDEHSGLFFRQD